jgi:hypothetical protein
MDAVNRYWQIVRSLVLERALIVFLLGLFYLLALFLSMTLDADKKASMILILSAIPACAFCAIATERVVLYSIAGASLGLPRQAELLRKGQMAILGLFVGVPACFALRYGAPASLAALLLVPAALGAFFALKGRWLFIVWIALAVGSRFFANSFGALFSELASPAVRLGAIVASMALFYWWLGLPARIETRARGISASLADARHEANSTSVGETTGLTSAQAEALERVYDKEIAAVTVGISDTRISARALSLGLGIDVRPNWRGVARMVGIGWAVLFGLHLIDSRSLRDNLYLWVAVLAASTLLSRVGAVRNAWQSHGTEEAILLLTPRWPNERQVKRLFVDLLVTCQAGVWLAWLLIILPFVVLGWLGRLEAGISIVLLFATSCGGTGAFLVAISRPRCKELSASTVALLLCSAVGVVAFLIGLAEANYARVLGMSLVVLPLIIGALSFSLRPLQIPVQIVSKQ